MKGRGRRCGFKLASLLIVHGAICAVCCVAFPHFVGPVDLSSESIPLHDPSFRLETAYSTPGTQAYVEIGAPVSGMPGCIIVNVVNNTNHPMDHVIVRYPLRHPIIFNPRTTDRDIIVTKKAISVQFDSIDPDVPVNRALDYRDPDVPVAPNSPANVYVPSETAATALNLSMASQ